MLEIKNFQVNPLQVNCYVVSDETKECCIIDCGAYGRTEFDEIKRYVDEQGLKPVHLLATHGHLDHVFGIDMAFEEWGLKLELHKKDKKLIENLAQQAELIFGPKNKIRLPKTEPGGYFTEDDEIRFGSHKLRIVETPGHSPGCVFFMCDEERVAFSGDTLFRGSIGRTDFIGSSQFMIIMSLRTICQMDDDIRVLPGHGPETTIGYECATNMFLDR